LLDAAAELDSDVILVGSSGIGSVRGRLLGSVSSHVVDHARCSVMVFHERQRTSPAHVAGIVVGVDGSPGAAAAVAAGRRLAAALDATLVLISAHDDTTALAPVTTDLRAETRRRAASATACRCSSSARPGSGALRDSCSAAPSRCVLNHAPCPVFVARDRPGRRP
jgi:nucleotide-binding universal stress UspA family protein